MALYTETLADWIANGWSLPAVFAIMPAVNGETFSQTFSEYFSDWEIGFETEELFDKKLKVRAKVICPMYKDIIEQIQAKIHDGIFQNSNKVSRTTRNYINNDIISTIDDTTGNSAVTESFETTGSSQKESQTDVIIRYQNEIKSIYQKCLDEFKCLFMGVL